MMKKIFCVAVLFSVVIAKAQIGINTDNPQAVLDVVSSNSGVLLPRMTSLEVKNIDNAVEGMLVYNTSLECLMLNVRAYNDPSGTDWRCLLVGSKGQLPENPFGREILEN